MSSPAICALAARAAKAVFLSTLSNALSRSKSTAARYIGGLRHFPDPFVALWNRAIISVATSTASRVPFPGTPPTWASDILGATFGKICLQMHLIMALPPCARRLMVLHPFTGSAASFSALLKKAISLVFNAGLTSFICQHAFQTFTQKVVIGWQVEFPYLRCGSTRQPLSLVLNGFRARLVVRKAFHRPHNIGCSKGAHWDFCRLWKLVPSGRLP